MQLGSQHLAAPLTCEQPEAKQVNNITANLSGTSLLCSLVFGTFKNRVGQKIEFDRQHPKINKVLLSISYISTDHRSSVLLFASVPTTHSS